MNFTIHFSKKEKILEKIGVDENLLSLPITQPEEIYQWAIGATASSYYSEPWNPSGLLGPPRNFPVWGDKPGNWAPKENTGTKEWLILNYAYPVFISGVDVFECLSVGNVVSISAKPLGYQNWVEIWRLAADEKVGSSSEQSRVFSPVFQKTTFKSKEIKIDLDCSNAVTWTEIDCVALRGTLAEPKNELRYAARYKLLKKLLDEGVISKSVFDRVDLQNCNRYLFTM
jgi:hypothetical protein